MRLRIKASLPRCEIWRAVCYQSGPSLESEPIGQNSNRCPSKLSPQVLFNNLLNLLAWVRELILKSQVSCLHLNGCEDLGKARMIL